jgi:hypothetical protein
MQRDKEAAFSVAGKIFYDAVEKRVAYVVVEDREEREHIISLYNEHLIYTIDLETGICTVEKSDRAFVAIAVPQNATFFSEAILGTSDRSLGGGVLVQIWGGNFTNPKGFYQIVMTVEGCIPLNDIFVSEDIGTVETFFSDIVGGITDPNAFIPPKNCPQP